MNKNLFRLVFNAARGQVMAVSEVASGHSGGQDAGAKTGEPGVSASNHPPAHADIAQAAIKSIVAAVAVVAASAGLSSAAWAQAAPATTIVVNGAAPASQQPTVTTTASGVTQVNIQTAVGGVSRNRYTQFDVGSPGLILNNSPVNSNTQLGGWVAGNTNLASGSASIILNEVNSTNPSQLRGYIEVAGQKAEVVIANPAGIAVNGGGFINASGATLTTGTPQFNGNSLSGYQVNGGTITVTGSGLDTATVGITKLQAQKIILQGGVFAKDLQVTTDNSTGTANAVAIDVAAIGGMYANKITILATGQGAGVNNAGSLQANSGAFTLSADGTLTNTGTLNSTATTRINADTVNNSTGGAIYGGSVAIAATTLNNAAANSTDTAPVIAARDSAGRVDIGVQTLNNQEGALIYSAGALAIGGRLDANGQTQGRATTVTNNSATLEAAGNIGITTANLANTYASLGYRVEVDPTTPATTGSADCGGDCTHTWVDTYYRAVAITGPNGAAVIRSGADIALDASTSAVNSSSQILAAGTLSTTGAGLDTHGIDLTTQVATRRNHTVTVTYMENGIDCPFSCHSERRWRYSYSTDLIARNQTIGPAQAQSRTTSPSSTTLPNSSLFSASSNASYLVETNPAFTNKQIWLSSDYMLSALSVDPDITQKRMGDGFYEQRLINEQVARLTGYARLANYSSDEQQYQALMNAGITLAQPLKLRVGIALTAEQVAQLTSDIVWLVQQEVTLKDGSQQKVLVPQVYAVARSGDLAANGALLSGNVVNLNTTGDISNSHGTIQGRELVSLNATNVRNLAGRIDGKAVVLNASQDIENIGGAVIAQQSLSATAGRDIVVQTTTLESRSATPSQAAAPTASVGGMLVSVGAAGGGSSAGLQTRSTDISRVAGLYVTGEAGVLLASAGRDVQLTAALLQSQGSTTVNAARNLTLNTVSTSASMDATKDADNYNRSSRSTEVGTTLQSAGNTTLTAGQDFQARAADVQASGNLVVNAGGNVTIESGVATSSVTSASKTSNSGFMSSSTRTERSSRSSTEAIASNFSGNNVTAISQNDLTIKGSNVSASQDLVLNAGKDVVIASAQATSSSSAYSKLTESGFSGDFMSGLSYGTSLQAQGATSQTTTQVASTVSGRNVSIQSTRDTTVAASNVLADKDISVEAGRNVNVLAAANTQTSTNQSESSSTSVGIVSGASARFTMFAQNSSAGNGSNTATSQSTSVLSANGGNLTVKANGGALTTQGADLLAADTITLQGKTVDLQAIADQQTSANHFESKSVTVGSALSGTVGSLATAISDNVQLANTTKNERLKNAASLKAGYDAYKLADKALTPAATQGASAAAGTANGDPSGSAIGVSISVGVSSSSQDSASSATQSRGTNAQAKTINVTATEGDLIATAAKLQADNIALQATRNVQLQAAANTSTVSSNNQSSNVGAGVNVGLGQQSGISFQVSASQANGRANGSETTFDNTRITAAKTLTVKSGSDTNLVGAQLAGDTVKMDVGGKLNIETLQDSSTYQSEQHSSGFSVSVCVPPLCYGVPVTGSVSMANQSLDHNYQSATGQSGIAAGSGGFDIKVAGNTDLKGAAITSSATPDKNTLQTASLTSSDLDNRQNTNSSSSSVNLGYSGANTMATLAQNAVSNGLGNMGGGAGIPENGSQSGKTQSVISAGNIVITGTGNAEKDAQSTTQVASLTSRDAKTANQTLSNTLTLQQAQAVQEQQKVAQENLQAGQLVGSVAFNVVGDIAQKNGWKDSSPQKIALHAIAGYIQASAAGQNGTTGALAAMGNEALTKVVNDYIDKALPMPESATPEQQREVNLSRKALAESAASLVGATTVAVAGGSNQQIALGGAVALNADRFNRQLHEDEKKKIKDLAKGDSQKETRLTDAACALIKCSAEYATGSQEYVAAKNSEIRGEGNTFELKQLADLKRTDSSFLSYGLLDKALDVKTNVVNTAAIAAGKIADIGVGVVKGGVKTIVQTGALAVDAVQLAGAGVYAGTRGESTEIKPVSDVGKSIKQDGVVDTATNLLAGTSDAMRAAGRGDFEPVGEVIGGVVVPVAVGKVVGKAGAIISEDVAVTTEGNRGVRTGTYEGATVGLDETSLLGQERSIPPKQGVIRGEPEAPPSNAKPEQIRSIARQNEAAQTLSEHGFDIEQLPNNSGRTNTRQPDLRINGELADVYSPKTPNVQSVWDAVNKKANPALIESYQAPNVVVNLADSALSASDVAQFVQRNPINGLKNLVVIKDGKVTVLTMGH